MSRDNPDGQRISQICVEIEVVFCNDDFYVKNALCDDEFYGSENINPLIR